MTELPEKHTARLANRSKRPPKTSDDVNITFSPMVTQHFADLEAAVRGKGHFDTDVLKNLHDWASGKSGSVTFALADMMMITSETVKHIRATGNDEAKLAQHRLLLDMIEPQTPPAATLKTQRYRQSDVQEVGG